MKRYLSICLLVIVILLTANTSVEASSKTEVSTKPLVLASDRHSTRYLTPFELVHSAYQGQYREHSIPGFGSFIYGIKTGKITAKSLVAAAIECKTLPPQAIDDRSYLGYVDLQLKPIRF
jgi:hypothetical protein